MRIVSWNIQWGRGADGIVDFSRIADEIYSIGDVDIICLQEVGCYFPGLEGQPDELGVDSIALLGNFFPEFEVVFGAGLDLPLPVRKRRDFPKRSQFGNLVLSRLKLGQIWRHMLPMPPDPAAQGMQRVCVEMIVEANQGVVRLLCTHLEYTSLVQRRAQLFWLRHLQEEVFENEKIAFPATFGKEAKMPFRLPLRPTPAILCGDFNFEPDSEEYNLMCQASDRLQGKFLWLDAWSVLYPDHFHMPTVGLYAAPDQKRKYCCDFIFITPELAPRVKALSVRTETIASDHQPLVLDLTDG